MWVPQRIAAQSGFRGSEFGGAYALHGSTLRPLPSFLRAPGREKICVELSRRAEADTLVARPKLCLTCQVSLPDMCTHTRTRKGMETFLRKQETLTVT